MKTYQSKTGYVKCIDGTCYEANTIYLGIYDKTDNYSDISQKEYAKYVSDKAKAM